MLVLHGFCSPGAGLSLWAEDSTLAVKSPSQAIRSARPHPFAASVEVLGCPQPDAEDVVQTALAKCLRHWRRVQRADRPEAYVHRILVNTFNDAPSRAQAPRSTFWPVFPGLVVRARPDGMRRDTRIRRTGST
ncbi:MAG: sigma factor [Nocardioidaceae bacterium]